MPKKSIPQPVKNSWESVKPVKKVSKTPKETKKSVKKPTGDKKTPLKQSKTLEEETRDAIAIGGVEYSTDKKGIVTVSQKVESKKGLFPNPFGRPVKYKPEYCEMLINFFYAYVQEVYVDRKYYGRNDGAEFMRPGADGLKRGMLKEETHKVLGSVYPTIERFACQIGVHRETLREWASITYPTNYRIVKQRGKLKYPQFSAAYALATQMQEAILIEWAMDGRFNSQFAIFLAKNRFGYKDKSEVEQTGVHLVGVRELDPEKAEALARHIQARRLPPWQR